MSVQIWNESIQRLWEKMGTRICMVTINTVLKNVNNSEKKMWIPILSFVLFLIFLKTIMIFLLQK